MPVAVNLYKIRDAKGEGGDLFRSVQRQRPQYQGIWIVAPDGRVLAAHHEIKNPATWTREVLDTLEAGKRAFGETAPREVRATDPLPHRGFGAFADGSVTLALTSRYVRGGGKESAPPAVQKDSLWLWDGPVRPDGPAVIDSITLTPAEWALFRPKSLTVGASWSLPESLARKFSRALSPSSDQSTMPRPEECSLAELKAQVESMEGGHVNVRLEGRWEAKHTYDGKPSYAWASAKGVLDLDQAGMTPRSIDMVFFGAYRMAPPYDTSDRPIAAVVDWRK